jgi:hypothetical protein
MRVLTPDFAALHPGYVATSQNCSNDKGTSMKNEKEMTSYQVGVAAEAFAAALFARAGFHVSVQYGANQPGYDLIVERERKPYLVSVKGSQDGGWGLTQSYLSNADYLGAIDSWRTKHGKEMIFCLVQFQNKKAEEMPDVFLASCGEIAAHLKASGAGKGTTILYMSKEWKAGRNAGLVEQIPSSWKFSKHRVDQLLRH